LGFGLIAAAILIIAFKRYWVPDILHNPVSLMMIFVALIGANRIQDEAGLLAVTVVGVALANQKQVSIRHVVEFKETLTVLLIALLFVTLSAGLKREDLTGMGMESLIFVGVMVLFVRPISIFLSTLGSSLNWRERLFLAWMAPRGIVAAAVASVFAVALSETGYPEAMGMVPITFLLVFATVLIYGLSAGPLARRLGLVHLNPQGILFVGAHTWARTMALALKKEEIPVLMIDTDWENVKEARMAGLPSRYGSALAEKTREEIDFSGLGRMLAITANNEVNSLACKRYPEDFGRNEVYQLPLPDSQSGRHEVADIENRGRTLFAKDLTFARLAQLFGPEPTISRTRLSDEYDYEDFQAEYGTQRFPLFVVKANGKLQIVTASSPPTPQAGDLILSVGSKNENGPKPAESVEEATKR
jgi:hypothetical protein